VLVACWSPKGGSGTTVVAVLTALAFARASAGGSLLVDLAGDVPAALGIPEPKGPGLADWLGASGDVGAEALGRLENDVGHGLSLLWRGEAVGIAGGSTALRAEDLASALGAEPRPVVADCGRADRSPGRELAQGATVSLCVLRPCYLALRRALDARARPSAVVLVNEPQRSLRRRDVEEVLGVPVWAELEYDPALARAVDAGLLASRRPRAADRALEQIRRAVAA
jgi:hypothetical protein